MTKRRKTHDEQQRSYHQQDDDYIPLPIQTFLWRQTSPFVRPFLGKARDLAQIEQRDACKLFERIFITNNIFGQSPSLTDAIASIDRWRLIKVSFPFVLQCTAALLNNKLIKDHTFNRLGGNEAKMMYTLQWILMNASEECADSENEAKSKATNVAMAAATAASLLKPADAATATAGRHHHHHQAGQTMVSQGSTSSASAAPDQGQPAQQPASRPGDKSTATPQSQHQHHQQPLQSTSSAGPNQQMAIPAATAAAIMGAVAVATPSSAGMTTLQMQATLPSSSSVSPICSSTPTKPLTPTNPLCCPSNYLLPISSIQMFVYYFAPIMEGLKHSDFLTSNQRLEIGAALWEPLFDHQLPNIHCLTAQIKTKKSSDSEAAFFSTAEKTTLSADNHPVASVLPASSSDDRRRRSSAMMLDQAQFGDVFLGGPTIFTANTSTNATVTEKATSDGKSKQSDSTAANQLPGAKHHTSTTSQQAIIGEQPSNTNCSYATYLDIATLRCLFISDWQESGVYWALSYLSNRMEDIQYSENHSMPIRARPKSKSLSDIDRDGSNKVKCSKNDRNAAAKSTQKVTGTPQKKHKNKFKSKSKDRSANKQESVDKSGDHSSTVSKFLRVDDGDNSDPDGKNPVRRLSFSSGMQTLANQIRKTSKRVKKTGDGENNGSQLSIHHNLGSSMDGKSTLSRMRRSSSADDLSSGQVSALSLLQKESFGQDNRDSTESHPVITISDNLPLSKSSKLTQQKSRNTSAETDQQYLLQSLYSKSLRNLDRLTRSQTVPKDLHIANYGTKKDQAEQNDSSGSTLYVDDMGRIDPVVVLRVLHSTSQRESACSQRVCDRILSLINKLISIGILKQNFLYRQSSHHRDLSGLLSTKQHEFNLIHGSAQLLKMDSEQKISAHQHVEEAVHRSALVHRIFVDVVFRLHRHLGCPNNCGMESTVDHHQQGHQSKLPSFSGKASLNQFSNDQAIRQSRIKLRDTLEHLCNYNKRNFIKYIQDVFSDRPLQQVVDILHSLLGFCRSDYLNALKHHLQIMSFSGQSAQFMPTPSTSGTNFQEGLQPKCTAGESLSSTRSDISANEVTARQAIPHSKPGCSSLGSPNQCSKKLSEMVESIIVSNSFKQLVTRMSHINKELKFQENTVLYCDIRRLISFTRENYNNVFRGIVLSALIDCTKLLNQQQKKSSNEQHLVKKQHGTTRPPSEDGSAGKDGQSTSKRGKAPRDTNEPMDIESEGPSDMPNYSDSSCAVQQGPMTQSYSSPQSMKHRTSLGSYRFYPSGGPKGIKQGASIQAFGQQDQQHNNSTGLLSLSKAKKKLEQVFGGKQGSKTKLNSSHLGEELAHSGSIGTADCDHNSIADEASRRASLIGYQSVGSIPENNLHQTTISPASYVPNNIHLLRLNQQVYSAVQTGMLNFSFLMESCSPGDFLDPALLAALLDLRSPVAVRASIFLECANFVHKCNRGQWPSWMRMSITTHRTSNSGLAQSSSGSKLRKSSSIQKSGRNNTLMYRAAGRAFYSWAEAIGARLEEMLIEEAENTDTTKTEIEMNNNLLSGEQGIPNNSENIDDQISMDADFFQATINGQASPFALKMAACQLLLEVTTFLRETYRYLPPAIVQHQVANSKMGDKISSIYDVSRAVTANRRWSMALSSLGFGQLPASLNAISAGAASSGGGSSSGNHLRNPTTNAIAEHPERRISFILHETNDEDEHDQKQGPPSSLGEPSPQAVVSSPLAPSVNTNEQQQEAMRKLTAGRHLSQSSASSAVVVAAATCLLRSSGVIDSQSHRRKSIKLKKTSQDKDQKDKKTKFAQDFDEEVENSSVSDAGMRRTDSLRSRRRVSGISEKSDTSDRPINGILHGPQEAQAQGELSGDESAGNGSCEEAYAAEVAERFEDESKIMSNMPWFKAIAMMNSSIDCNCTHFPNCKQNCYKLHQNMCRRLISFVQSIYQDTNNQSSYASKVFESRLANIMDFNNQQKGDARAGSDCSAGATNSEAELKRKDRKAKKHLIEDEHSQASPKNPKHHEKSANRIQSMMSFHLDSAANGYGLSTMMTDTVKALATAHANEKVTAKKSQEEHQILKYMRSSVKSILHCPMSSFLKGAVILPRENFVEMIQFSWNLLLEDDQQISRTAAVGFIISAIKCPVEASKLLLEELASTDASRKMAAINKFYVIWDARYQCWPRLEDGAFVHFKMAPPSIEFTLPSPKIAQESRPVVDPPWIPRKTSNVEEVTIGQDQTVQKSFVTATKTRRKQQIEIVTKALREKHDKMREDRENYQITSAPVTLYAAYEPTLGNQVVGDEMDGGGANADDDAQQENRALLQMKTAQALFPTCLCQAAIVMINLLDDSRVTYEGSAVYEIAGKVIWSCLVEDPALFLRYFFERLTRQNQNTIFQVLRRLIRFMPRLPPQAAYTLYNYLIGFIIYYIRCPVESSQKLIADTLSVLCLVVPSVYGLFLKDLKQILRKEQCDHNLLITANVPSAKKIIIHGSDSSGIPSQFPIDETTQFYHILVDSLEFFGIEKPKQNEYFLIDVRTNHMHNLHSYVRDYYSFKRSQHPQLQLINMDPSKAFDILQQQELVNQFLEFGKVSMSLSIVKSSHMAVQRVLFLHEELVKLPTFPRKALETNFSLFRGPLGHQVFSMDRIHKICWVRVIARMFELTSGFFLQLGDIQLFLNSVSGIFVLHCEEASVSRLCLATFINASHQFKNIFATDGFMPIMATIVQVYSNHQNNQILCRSIEFVCKQFYIMHRKPFLLQLFGSVASRLNTAETQMRYQSNHPLGTYQSPSGGGTTNFVLSDPSRISPAAFFKLLQSLEKAFKDPLDILELVDLEKPLRAIDFCYQQDKEAIEILDIISLCVTVTAYASESPRSTQMLIILETVVPLYMKHLQASTSKKAGQSMGKQAHKDELQKIQSISICIRTLIINCEGLTRAFNGPLPSIDFRSSSIRRKGRDKKSKPKSSGGSPIDFYDDEPSISGPERFKKETRTAGKQTTIVGGLHRGNKNNLNSEESEITRGEFLVPRDTLLNLVAEFLALSTGRLVESAKKYVDLHQKNSSYELLDVKSHLRLAEVANSLLKFACNDPSAMACPGLIRYMNEILPNTEWRQEAIRPALIMILKRLDKTFNRIAKKSDVKRTIDWEGAKQLLKGAYLTFIKHPYIVHLPHLKSLISCCQNVILSDDIESQIGSNTVYYGLTSPQSGGAYSQSASLVPTQDRPSRNLLAVGSGYNGTSASLSPSESGYKMQATSAPSTLQAAPVQQALSFATVTATATLAERLAASATPSNSITTQGFNSVTIRLIAMQLLQTGDSQTLENLVGNFLSSPEKLESLMLNLIYPMCIRVCSGAREAPKLRVCDIMFILNVVLNMLAPNSASSRSCSTTSSSPKAASDTSQFILSKITTTISSTQTGATALGIVGSSAHSAASTHQISQHPEGLKIGFLGLKILCVCFDSQLAGEWIRITRVIRDLAMQSGQPSGPLWDFLDFVATYRFPMFILLLPTIKCNLAKKVKNEKSDENAAHYIQYQRLIRAKIHGSAPTVCRSKSFLFVSLTAELQMLKEQLNAKRKALIDGERRTSAQNMQQASNNQGSGGLSQNAGQSVDGSSQQGDHFNAYYRLSAAIASFANQGTQGKMTPSASSSNAQQTGTSAALKGTCFAAQLATSTPLTDITNTDTKIEIRNEAPSGSARLSTAKNREEARKVMNTILRRTSYPHNQALVPPDKQNQAAGCERKNSQPPSPLGGLMKSVNEDIEAGNTSPQIIMDPAMLLAAFPAPRKPAAEGSSILKQLVQTIDRQNQKQQKQQTYQTTTFQTPQGDAEESVGTQADLLQSPGEQRSQMTISKSQGFQIAPSSSARTTSHRHEQPYGSREGKRKSEI